MRSERDDCAARPSGRPTMANTELLARIDAAIAEKSLLKHPFYQDWQAGKLSREGLQLYAAQDYRTGEAFPKHLRVLAARTEGPLQGLIRENLAEEESPTGSHPKLWRGFAGAGGGGGGGTRGRIRSCGGILRRRWEWARTTLRAVLLCRGRRPWCTSFVRFAGTGQWPRRWR